MSKNNNYWITPRDGGWAVKREGTSRASGIYPTQRDAFNIAREKAKSEGGEVIIQNKENRIREKNTYGKPDHYPPKG